MRRLQMISLALVLLLEGGGYPSLPSPQHLAQAEGKEIGIGCLSLGT